MMISGYSFSLASGKGLRLLQKSIYPDTHLCISLNMYVGCFYYLTGSD